MNQSSRSGSAVCAEMLARLAYHKHCPIVTVAGTNGKGTSCHLLADYWQRRGRKVGLFTSPHLLHFNERICMNQQQATDQDIAAAFARIEAVQGDLDLGYFHRAFLAAVLIFEAAAVDLMILEVGIGGRLDAVNSLDADYALLTTIALDHTEILGATRELIGYEKAGIFRARQLVVCGELDPPASVLQRAQDLQVRLFLRGRDFDLADLAAYPEGHIPRQNALAVWALLQKMDANFEAAIFAESLAQLIVPGRMQCVGRAPEILIDVAHNPHSAAYLAAYLKAHPVEGQTYAIFSALRDKDIQRIMSPFVQDIHAWFFIELAHERGAGVAELHQAVAAGTYQDFQSMPALYAAALKKAGPQDRIVVFGSFLLVGLFLECHNQSIELLGAADDTII